MASELLQDVLVSHTDAEEEGDATLPALTKQDLIDIVQLIMNKVWFHPWTMSIIKNKSVEEKQLCFVMAGKVTIFFEGNGGGDFCF